EHFSRSPHGVSLSGTRPGGRRAPPRKEEDRAPTGQPTRFRLLGHKARHRAGINFERGFRLSLLLRFSRLVDLVNVTIGHAIYWLVLAAALVSAGNAVVRYTFNTSSNAWLEIQWYLFSAVFLLCAGYTLERNEHVRIDVVASRLSRRTQTWIDVV